jgi:hypothetical protein
MQKKGKPKDRKDSKTHREIGPDGNMMPKGSNPKDKFRGTRGQILASTDNCDIEKEESESINTVNNPRDIQYFKKQFGSTTN